MVLGYVLMWVGSLILYLPKSALSSDLNFDLTDDAFAVHSSYTYGVLSAEFECYDHTSESPFIDDFKSTSDIEWPVLESLEEFEHLLGTNLTQDSTSPTNPLQNVQPVSSSSSIDAQVHRTITEPFIHSRFVQAKRGVCSPKPLPRKKHNKTQKKSIPKLVLENFEKTDLVSNKALHAFKSYMEQNYQFAKNDENIISIYHMNKNQRRDCVSGFRKFVFEKAFFSNKPIHRTLRKQLIEGAKALKRIKYQKDSYEFFIQELNSFIQIQSKIIDKNKTDYAGQSTKKPIDVKES